MQHSTPHKLINEIHLTGVIATEPEQSGNGPTRFRIAHGGGGKRKDGTPWPTQFFSVACWHRNVVKDLRKGTRVELFGALRDSTYKTKDGTMRSAVEIVADAIIPQQPAEKPPAPITPNYHGVEISDDDIPF